MISTNIPNNAYTDYCSCERCPCCGKLVKGAYNVMWQTYITKYAGTAAPPTSISASFSESMVGQNAS